MVPFAASNAGVLVAWSAPLLERFEGVPIKNAALTAGGRTVRGEPTITATGLEGGPISRWAPNFEADMGLRSTCNPTSTPTHWRPVSSIAAGRRTPCRPGSGKRTQPGRRRPLRDATGNRLPTEATAIAGLAKAVPIPVGGLAPIDRAISTAGGIALDAIDDTGMLLDRPGTWVAGEMVAWDAPTGGYLIQACLSTGRRAGVAAARWAAEHP